MSGGLMVGQEARRRLEEAIKKEKTWFLKHLKKYRERVFPEKTLTAEKVCKSRLQSILYQSSVTS